MIRAKVVPSLVCLAAVLFLVIVSVHLTCDSAAATPFDPPSKSFLPLIVKAPPAPTPTSTPTSTPTPTPAGVVILSSNAFVPYSGSTSLYVVGEVKNTSASNVRFVKINAVLRDNSGQIVDGDYSYALAEVIKPGDLSPFRIIFSNAPTWVTYELTVTWSTTTESWYLLELDKTESYFDSSDAYHVRGSVRNQYTVERKFVELLLTFYDNSDRVIGVDWTYTNPTSIASDAEISFDVEAYFWMGKPSGTWVTRYAIVAGGD